MKNFIKDLVEYPVDAESNMFFNAFASLNLHIDNITENTPYYCEFSKELCAECGRCSSSIKERYHLQRYNMYESISGVSLLWKDEALYDTFEMDYVKGVLPDKIDDRIDYTMKAAGYNYIRLRKDMGRKAVFSQIKASVDNNIPVMLYMGNRGNWTLINGYDTETCNIYGHDANKEYFTNQDDSGYCYCDDWFHDMNLGLVVTEVTEKQVDIREFLARMESQLLKECNKELHELVIKKIDNPEDNLNTSIWLTELINYTIEARWHVAIFCVNELYRMLTCDKSREKACYITDSYIKFHDLGWDIWAALGVTPKDPSKINDVFEKHEQKRVLIDLYKQIFELDNDVCRCLKEFRELEVI